MTFPRNMRRRRAVRLVSGLRARAAAMRRDPERGDADVIAMAVLVPALLLLLLLLIAVGRVQVAGGSVEAAARSAARAASLTTTPGAASAAASSQAAASLTGQGLSCQTLTTTPDVSGFTGPPGQPGIVRVTVSCRLALSDVAVPGLPGSLVKTATFASPVDPYRSS
jgi:Flp pilus assembly protein TadG